MTEEERAEMLKFAAFKQIAAGIIAKWRWFLVLFFVVADLALSVALVARSAKSVNRFNATTRLLFMPRSVGTIATIGDKQLLSIIDRRSLKRRVAKKIPMPAKDKMCLVADLKIVQERKPTNLFTLTANASSWVGAVKKVNAYAEVLIAEYVAYRMRELSARSDVLELRRKSCRNDIAHLDAEEAVARAQAGVPSPVETLTMVNSMLSDQRRNLSDFGVQIANEEMKLQKVISELGPMASAVRECAPLIRKRSAELAEIDKDIAKLREKYTDLHPRVKGKLEDRQKLVDSYLSILKEKGVGEVSAEDVEKIDVSERAIADITMKLAVLKESRRSLESQIEDNEKRSAALTGAVPVLERIKAKRDEAERILRDIDTQLGDIEYLRMTVESDLQQIERAGGAGDNNPLSVKNFAIAFVGAVVTTMTVLFWIVTLEFFFGKVRGAKELGAYNDVTVIGSLPKPGTMGDEEERDVLGVVSLKFCDAKIPKDVILLCRLPGAPEHDKFAQTLDWVLSMAGQRSFVLEVIPSTSFEPPEGCETMLNTFRKDSRGYFPVANRYVLAPAEVQMLQADIAALRNDFDIVFIHMQNGMNRGGSFFSQLIELCQSAFLMVGAGATPRSELAYARNYIKKSGKPMLGLVTDASAKVVKREMEAMQ